MLEMANSILEKNIETRSDYVKKYEELLQKMEENDRCAEAVPETNREEIVKRLKAFRLEQSRKEKLNHTTSLMMRRWGISLIRSHRQKKNYFRFQNLGM